MSEQKIASPLRGEVWLVNFDPSLGREQGGSRPAMIISVDPVNAGPSNMVIVVPITSRSKGIRSQVQIEPPEGGLVVTSYIKCEDVRAISKERITKRLGATSARTMMEAEDKLRILIGL